MKKKFLFLSLLLLVSCSLVFDSCSSFKNYKYFEDIPDASGEAIEIQNSNYKEPVIQNDDILFIAIQTLDPGAGASINSLNTQTTNGGSLPTISSPNSIAGNQGSIYGYLVDKQGLVTIPVLGNMHVAGLTTTQAREEIKVRAAKFYKDASVIVRFGNFKITVLGEVQHPGTYTVPNEKVTLLDALGYAGDLTIYGKRDNVLLLRRQPNGLTTAIRLNLNKSSVIQSPYFYLQQNDEIYVEPAKAKITASDASQARNITIVTSVITILIVLLTRIR